MWSDAWESWVLLVHDTAHFRMQISGLNWESSHALGSVSPGAKFSSAKVRESHLHFFQLLCLKWIILIHDGKQPLYSNSAAKPGTRIVMWDEQFKINIDDLIQFELPLNSLSSVFCSQTKSKLNALKITERWFSTSVWCACVGDEKLEAKPCWDSRKFPLRWQR